ncbi:MAG: 50S ribosomal protein L21 [Patescibacteria group bacterium]|jgi:large subunit ribosomal protein L21|nr:50S ribosomal protein L21 [Patescibacteria group bacterium]MDD3777884.1 50S ribosomal protein L21 [Patescibacteria group bacterium]MDD3939283.1 50S ribosomal protein L21 [Patescibacteria group bacterium]MDD4443810.1 50S ribosomal protein L21 [Patescibacteria group bacterium]NCU39793.1 50S ribosomal protein L21 [Candidatus Falkowbacteria bacterium]
MSKIAVIKTGGKQYKVAEGQTLSVEKLDDKDKKVKLDTLLIADGDKVEVGEPSLGEKVEAEILENGKGDKVTVVKYKNKTRYKRTIGHRQEFSSIKITKIA